MVKIFALIFFLTISCNGLASVDNSWYKFIEESGQLGLEISNRTYQPDKYSLQVDLISEGHFGSVYKISNGKISCAIKVPKKEANSLVSTNELNIMQIICKSHVHANIVKLYGFHDLDQNKILILEFVDGLSLFETVQKSKKFIPHYISVFSQLASALSYVHSFGIVHSDVKPENVIVKYAEDGGVNIKLCDFGLSFSKYDLFAKKDGGSFGYHAPELGYPDKYNSEDECLRDVFSYGVTATDCVIWIQLDAKKDWFFLYDKSIDRVYRYWAKLFLAALMRGENLSKFQDEIKNVYVLNLKPGDEERIFQIHQGLKEAFSNCPNLLDLIGNTLQPNPNKRLNMETVKEKFIKPINSSLAPTNEKCKKVSGCDVM